MTQRGLVGRWVREKTSNKPTLQHLAGDTDSARSGERISMIGLQWCSNCDAPRFGWSILSLDEIPTKCWDCGQDAVAVRLTADRIADLRRELGLWALGDQRRRAGGAHESVNRRRSHVQERFDQVLGWWAKNPRRHPELLRLLREYRYRGRVTPEPIPSNDADDAPEDYEHSLLDPDRLHELTEQ